MSNNFKPGEIVLTPEGRAQFVHIFKPQANKNGDLIYEMNICIPKTTDLTGVYTSVKNMIAANFLGPTPTLKNPFKDGDVPNTKNKIHEGFAGCTVFRAWSKYPVYVFAPDGKSHITSPSDFYNGCYCRIRIQPGLYDNEGYGISLFLDGIQKIKDGDRFGGGADPNNGFEAVANSTPGTGFEAVANSTPGTGFQQPQGFQQQQPQGFQQPSGPQQPSGFQQPQDSGWEPAGPVDDLLF